MNKKKIVKKLENNILELEKTIKNFDNNCNGIIDKIDKTDCKFYNLISENNKLKDELNEQLCNFQSLLDEIKYEKDKQKLLCIFDENVENCLNKKCKYYDELFMYNCSANEDLCEKCFNDALKKKSTNL